MAFDEGRVQHRGFWTVSDVDFLAFLESEIFCANSTMSLSVMAEPSFVDSVASTDLFWDLVVIILS